MSPFFWNCYLFCFVLVWFTLINSYCRFLKFCFSHNEFMVGPYLICCATHQKREICDSCIWLLLESTHKEISKNTFFLLKWLTAHMIIRAIDRIIVLYGKKRHFMRKWQLTCNFKWKLISRNTFLSIRYFCFYQELLISDASSYLERAAFIVKER